jgi:methylated-DNA-[protein]-cysteine S-methyltransferase
MNCISARFFKRGARRRYASVDTMTACGYALFDTAIGRCGIAWSARGIAAVQLPEAREIETRARLRQRCPEAREAPPPPDVQRALDAITALLRGEASDLSAVALDLDRVAPFERRVYEVARTIPPGARLSYGEVAGRLGAPGAARAVGRALGRNPLAILVPCHRVVAAGGKAGGFSAHGGTATKLRLLAIEAARAHGASPLFDAPAP